MTLSNENLLESDWDDYEFEEDFDHSSIDVIETIKETRVSTVEMVTDGEYIAVRKTILPRFSDAKISRFEKGYDMAKLLGISVPPHKFGDNWIVSQYFEEHAKVNGICDNDLVHQSVPDQIGTALAKCYLFINHDCTPDNIIITGKNEFMFIDVQSADIRFMPRLRYSVTKTLQKMGIHHHAIELIEARAVRIAEMFINNELFIDPHKYRQLVNEQSDYIASVYPWKRQIDGTEKTPFVPSNLDPWEPITTYQMEQRDQYHHDVSD